MQRVNGIPDASLLLDGIFCVVNVLVDTILVDGILRSSSVGGHDVIITQRQGVKIPGVLGLGTPVARNLSVGNQRNVVESLVLPISTLEGG